MLRTSCAASLREAEACRPPYGRPGAGTRAALTRAHAPKVRGAPTQRSAWWGVAPCLHTVRAGRARGDCCPRGEAETGGRQVVSFLPVKGQGKDVMPLQMREMRLFAKGQVLEEEVVVKLVSALSLPLPPSPPTPPTKPGGALYGLDFTGAGLC